MAVAFLLDEHFRGLLFGAIQRHNVTGGRPLDAEQVGDPDDLPLGTLDPDILIWAERNGRIVVTHDARTMIADFIAHLAAGRHSRAVRGAARLLHRPDRHVFRVGDLRRRPGRLRRSG